MDDDSLKSGKALYYEVKVKGNRAKPPGEIHYDKREGSYRHRRQPRYRRRHRVKIVWSRFTESFAYEDYNREHVWRFENGIEVTASAAPAFLGKPECVDPEEAFVAAISSCHMLTFLVIAARKRITVDSYEDDAVGFLEKNPAGKLAITRVILRPRITFNGAGPSPETFEWMHERSHHECFIANSVLTEITVEPDQP